MDPQQPTNEPGRSGGADEALRRLEARLAKASEAAERLVAEATGAARGAGAGAGAGSGGGADPGSGSSQRAPGEGRTTPPAGWQQPATGEGGGRLGGDVELLSQILSSLRDLVPPDLQHRLADALRELLMALRALIDWYLERTERRRAAPIEVQDIPIL